MANNRVYYAIQQVNMGSTAAGSTVARGVQSVGITTNFNLEQVFELGQQAIYQNVENVPDVEVTLNKVLDGYPSLYVLATETGTGIGTHVAETPTLAGRSNARTDLYLSIYKDTATSATGTPLRTVACSGMYVSSVAYTFPVEGNFTEDVTLVGNNKVWGAAAVTGAFTGNDDNPEALTGVGRRQYLDMANCVFPNQIPGIVSGANTLIGGGSGHAVHFQNIKVNTDFGREPMYEIGTMAPYHRYVKFPVEVTSEFEVMAGQSGDGIQASESGYYTAADILDVGSPSVASPSDTGCTPRFNLRSDTIFLQTCEGTKIWIGDKNKLTSVNYTGGEAGGDNVSITYSFQTFNDFTVAHSGGQWYENVGTGFTDGYDG
jgi:hypothetical protein